jgi:hypothetical protein
MPDLFDHLSARIQSDDSKGISPVDLADLPIEQRQMMLTLLRDSASAFEGVQLQNLREKLEGKDEHFDETLALLVRNQWLIVLGEEPSLRYRLNFRAKRGSSSDFNLWMVLTDRLPKDWKGTGSSDAT